MFLWVKQLKCQKKKKIKKYCASLKTGIIRPWVKEDVKVIQTSLRNIPNRAAKSSEIAPKFPKNSDNEFQDALARKDFDKAKKILENAKNLEEWRRLNLEGLITISQGDLVATERISTQSDTISRMWCKTIQKSC